MASLKKNSSWLITSNLFFALTQGAILVALAHLGGPQLVGEFSFALALAAPIMLFFNLGLRSLISTDHQRQHTDVSYQQLRQLSAMAGAVVCGLAALVFAPTWLVMALTLTLAFSKMAEAQSELLYGFLQRANYVKPIALSMALRGGLGAIGLIGCYAITKNLLLATLVYALLWSMIAYGYDSTSTRQRAGLQQPPFPRRIIPLIPLFQLALPLGIGALMINLSLSLPRLFLGHSVSLEAVGYFSSFSYLVGLGGIVANALGQSLSPKLALLWQAKAWKNYIRLVAIGLAACAALGVGGFFFTWVAGQGVITLLFGETYKNQSSLLILLAGAAPIQFMGNFAGFLVLASRATKAFAFQRLIWLALMFSACVSLIPVYGVMGAVGCIYLAAVSNLLLSLISTLYLARKTKLSI